MAKKEFAISRLLTYLANIRTYPTSLTAASVVSGMSEMDIRVFLNRYNYSEIYVVGKMIVRS